MNQYLGMAQSGGGSTELVFGMSLSSTITSDNTIEPEIHLILMTAVFNLALSVGIFPANTLIR